MDDKMTNEIEETEKKEDKTTVDYICLLEERADEMKKSIDNVETVISEQNYIVEKLDVLKEDEKVAVLITGLSEQTKRFEKQLEVMKDRYNMLLDVCKTAKDNTEVKLATEKLLLALGVFEK